MKHAMLISFPSTLDLIANSTFNFLSRELCHQISTSYFLDFKVLPGLLQLIWIAMMLDFQTLYLIQKLQVNAILLSGNEALMINFSHYTKKI